MMERLSFVLLVPLAGCAHQSRPQTGYRPVVVGTITEQQSHTTALLQAVSAVDDGVVWVSGHQATWVRTVDGGRTWVPGAMTGPDSALEFRDVEGVSTTTAYLLAAGPGRSEEHTSELQSRSDLVCRLLLEKKKTKSTPLSHRITSPYSR